HQMSDRPNLHWLHAAAESTNLPAASYDLVSACLLFHELPQTAAIAILQEARRLLRPGGHLAIMDMNPQSEIHAKMPPYILTLLKSTEPYLDQYFALDLASAIVDAGFAQPTLTCNTPRHRTLIAQVN
ncbi:MAG TPA: class I SAM-dependent methyltransferase, partial [Leptolyngbya sp.]|nr:class I SAM-dependent methyltransferase [Leptolyngbya sp.]